MGYDFVTLLGKLEFQCQVIQFPLHVKKPHYPGHGRINIKCFIRYFLAPVSPHGFKCAEIMQSVCQLDKHHFQPGCST